MSKTRAAKTRAEIHEIINNMPAEGRTSLEIVKLLLKRKGKIVQTELSEILEIGLTKIVGDVFRWRAAKVPAAQLELFEVFRIPKTYSIREAGKKPVHKKREEMTLHDARLFVEQHEMPRTQSREVEEVTRAILFAESEKAKPTDKLVDVWERAKGSGSGG